MKNSIWLTFGVILVLAFLLPFLFTQVMLIGLAKLQLSPSAAFAAILAIIFGGFINIPIKRVLRTDAVDTHPLAAYGLSGLLPQMGQSRPETIIAINLGGCVIPTLIALYEFVNLAGIGMEPLVGAVAAAVLNAAACYLMARPVPGIGIFIPGLVPPLIAAASALLLVPDNAAPVAFIAGTLGPLIGADLFHLKEIERSAVGIASIGGAGTFDGIVLSGMLAAFLT